MEDFCTLKFIPLKPYRGGGWKKGYFVFLDEEEIGSYYEYHERDAKFDSLYTYVKGGDNQLHSFAATCFSVSPEAALGNLVIEARKVTGKDVLVKFL